MNQALPKYTKHIAMSPSLLTQPVHFIEEDQSQHKYPKYPNLDSLPPPPPLSSPFPHNPYHKSPPPPPPPFTTSYTQL